MVKNFIIIVITGYILARVWSQDIYTGQPVCLSVLKRRAAAAAKRGDGIPAALPCLAVPCAAADSYFKRRNL